MGENSERAGRKLILMKGSEMTEKKPPKSFIDKAKIFWSNIYATPFFWLKAIFFAVTLGLAIFGLYKIVDSAFHYFNEPLSYFDPERLGQLGDFLGGTLNPIFGFATVCLLLWSVFIQRKELNLTREELTKSATALNDQVKLATDEYNRIHLENILRDKIEEYRSAREKTFLPISITVRRQNRESKVFSFQTLSDFIKSQNYGEETFEKISEADVSNLYDQQHSDRLTVERIKIFEEFKSLTMTLVDIHIEILKITKIEIIKYQLRVEASEKLLSLQKIHLLTPTDVGWHMNRINSVN